jgi:hypothetical protein
MAMSRREMKMNHQFGGSLFSDKAIKQVDDQSMLKVVPPQNPHYIPIQSQEVSA